MRRAATALLAATLLCIPASAFAVTVNASFNAGNLFYGPDRSIDTETLPYGTYLYGGSAFVAANVTDDLSLTVGFERDHVLNNYAYLRFAHTGPVATIAVGPVLGVANDLSRWYYATPGIYSLVRVELGTLGYLSFSSISSGFLALDGVGDTNQSAYNAEIGSYGLGRVTSIYLDNRAFTTLTSDGRIEDSATQYGLRINAFKKNVNYRLILDFAYASLKRNYTAGETNRLHHVGTVLFTPTVQFDVGSLVTVGLGAENGLYTFGLDYLLGEFEADKYFFNAFADVTLRLGE
ncbi:MAG: hypothetical protein ACOCYG_03195 [Spirochaetota bacterium]